MIPPWIIDWMKKQQEKRKEKPRPQLPIPESPRK